MTMCDRNRAAVPCRDVRSRGLSRLGIAKNAPLLDPLTILRPRCVPISLFLLQGLFSRSSVAVIALSLYRGAQLR